MTLPHYCTTQEVSGGRNEWGSCTWVEQSWSCVCLHRSSLQKKILLVKMQIWINEWKKHFLSKESPSTTFIDRIWIGPQDSISFKQNLITCMHHYPLSIYRHQRSSVPLEWCFTQGRKEWGEERRVSPLPLWSH